MLKTVALFLDSKAAETGAAQNTLEAYARDNCLMQIIYSSGMRLSLRNI